MGGIPLQPAGPRFPAHGGMRKPGEVAVTRRRGAGWAPGALATPWLPLQPAHGDGIRLFCLPHAGAGSLAFQGWDAGMPAPIQVLPVLPPGREARFWEAPYTRLDPYVRDLAIAITPHLQCPYALFGHSLGALVAFELARTLRAAGAPGPSHLFVSGRIAPHLSEARPILHTLERAALLQEMATLGGLPEGIALSEQLLDYLVPVLRADLAVNETYEFRDRPPLTTPITALGGTADPRASCAELAQWQVQAAGSFTLRTFDGGHFYLARHRTEVLSLMADALLRCPP